MESLRAALASSDLAKQVVEDELRKLRATQAEHVHLSQAQGTQACDTTSQLEDKVGRFYIGDAPISGETIISAVEDLCSLTSSGILGKGSFGTVELWENGCEQYAVKAFSKNKVAEQGLAEAVSNERAVMAQLNNNFIIRLIYTCQDRHHIFLLMEPAPGGDLFHAYAECGLFGHMGCASFHMCCVTLALDHLHGHGIIHRDLKLENCLLDAKGYVKLSDMGLAKVLHGKTYSLVGTVDYVAPEVLRQKGYDAAADWWASGILLFCMGAGRTMFVSCILVEACVVIKCVSRFNVCEFSVPSFHVLYSISYLFRRSNALERTSS